MNNNKKLKDSLKQLNAKFDELKGMDKTQALMASGLTLQAEAMRRSPWDTGNNINSARTEIAGENLVEMSFNTEYSYYLEFGTSKMQARPYIRPAIDESEDKIVQAFINQYRKDMGDVING
jgi:HK97 gp10 family phage protein